MPPWTAQISLHRNLERSEGPGLLHPGPGGKEGLGPLKLWHEGCGRTPWEGPASFTRRPSSRAELHSHLSSRRHRGDLKGATKTRLEARGREVRDSRRTLLQVQRSKRQPARPPPNSKTQRSRKHAWRYGLVGERPRSERDSFIPRSRSQENNSVLFLRVVSYNASPRQ